MKRLLSQLGVFTLLGLVALCTPAPAAEAPGQWGTLKGRLLFGGSAPEPTKVNVSKDAEFCGQFGIVDESLLVGSDRGLANVVVTLYVARGGQDPQVHPSYAQAAEAKVSLDNRGCRFDPHVCLLRTTQTLLIGNKDPVGHNTKIDAFSNDPINPIILGGGQIEARFPQPERVPIPVSCSIHPWMKAYLVIRQDPYMAISDAKGEFEIKNLPAGTWTFQFWQERAGYLSNVTVGGRQAEWTRGRTEFTIAPGENNLGEIVVDPQLFAK